MASQSNLQANQSADYGAQLSDLQKVSNGNFTGLQTGQYIREVSAMQEKIAQVQNQLETLKHLEAELLYYQQQWQQEANVSNATGSICHLIEEISIKN